MAEARAGTVGWRWPVAVAVLAALAHSGALRVGLLFDDALLVAQNPFLDDFGNIARLFDPTYFDSGELSWRPVATLLHLCEVALFGKSAAALHFVSVLLHAGCAGLLTHLLQRLGLPAAAAALGGALFAVHPAIAEAVLVVTFREDLLATAFLLGGCLLVLRGPGGPGRAAAIAACTAGALGSKETALVFPLCYALVAWCRLRSPDAGDAGRAGAPGWRAWWMVAAACGAVLLGYLVLRFGVIVHPREAQVPRVAGGFTGLVAADGWIVGQYAGLAIAPFTLSVDRTLPRSGAWLGTLIGLAVVVAVAVVAWRARRTAPGVTAGLAWTAATLAPVMNVVPLSVPLAERYLYLPMCGLAWAVASALAPRLPGRDHPRLGAVIGTVALCLLLLLIRVQVRAGDFTGAETLWRATLAASPDSPRACSNLALVLGERGRPGDLDESIRLHRRARRLMPVERTHRRNLAVVLTRRSDLRAKAGDRVGAREDRVEALEALRELVAADPAAWESWMLMATLLDKMEQDYTPADGAPLTATGCRAQAESALVTLTRDRPDQWRHWLNLAMVRDYQGNAPGQLHALAMGVQAAPGRLEPTLAYAAQLARLRRYPAVLDLLQAAPASVRETPQVQLLRVQALASLGRRAEALTVLRAAARRWPRDPGLRRAMAQLSGRR